MNKLIIVFIMSVSVYSQSLDSLIVEALSNNIGIKSYSDKINSLQHRAGSINVLPPPSFLFSFDQIKTDEWNIWDKALSQSFGISQMFPLGNKPSLMSKVELKKSDVLMKELLQYKLNLIQAVKENYFNAQLLQAKRKLNNNLITSFEELIKISNIRYANKTAAYSEILLLKTQLAELKAKNIMLENESKIFLSNLNYLIGRQSNDAEIKIEDPKTFSLYVDNEIEIESIPSIDKMNEMIEMNKQEIKANSSEWIPDLMFSAMVMRMPQGMILTDQMDIHKLSSKKEVEWMYSLMASVTLPFMPWSSNKISEKNIELDYSISSLRNEQNEMKRKMTAEINEMKLMIKNLKNEIELYENEIIPLYEEIIQTMKSEFENNQMSMKELIEMQNMILDKKIMLEETKTQYLIAVSKLESFNSSTIKVYER